MASIMPNFFVPPGQPRVCAFGVVLCHPDDYQALLAVERRRRQVAQEFAQALASFLSALDNCDEGR